MSEVTYKNIHTPERRFPIKGEYQVVGDAYVGDVLVQKKVPMGQYILLRSADQFIENYEKTEQLKLEREQMRADKEKETDQQGNATP